VIKLTNMQGDNGFQYIKTHRQARLFRGNFLIKVVVTACLGNKRLLQIQVAAVAVEEGTIVGVALNELAEGEDA
jgi:hypothetical protein